MRPAIIAISALMVWALPSAVAQAAVPETAAPVAGVSAAAHPGQKGAPAKRMRLKRALVKRARLRRAVRKCRAIRKGGRRRVCHRRLRLIVRRHRRRAEKPKPKPGRTWRVYVRDNYEEDWFSPNHLEIKSGDSIAWIWSNENQNPHNVTPVRLPAGVNRNAYKTPNSPSTHYRWVRRFDRVGTWTFACSLHDLMKLTVKVRE